MLDGLAAAIGRPLTAADVEPYSWALAGVGASLTDATYSASQTWQRAYTAEVSAWWANDFDLLLTPAAGEPPALLEELLPPPADPLSILPRFERIWCFAAPFSVTGQPAISLPIGQTAGGLPVGIQLVARARARGPAAARGGTARDRRAVERSPSTAVLRLLARLRA